jgi:hypothetical protein
MAVSAVVDVHGGGRQTGDERRIGHKAIVAAGLALVVGGCGGGDEPRAPARGLAALSDLQPVAVRVLELRDVAPGELEHV